MKRATYKGYVIDTDDLGREYIYNTESTYSEDSDRILIDISDFGTLKAAKAIIDERIRTGKDIRKVYKSPAGEMYFAI